MLEAVSNRLRMALVTGGGLPLGGSTTFLCNLGGELVRRGVPVQVWSFTRQNPLKDDFDRLNIPVRCLDETRVLWEERVETILQDLQRFEPTVVVANLSAESFEILRYVPKGVFRVGMTHADDERVYTTIERYISHLDLLAVVSEAILGRLKSRPSFAPARIRYLPYGVPMPAANSASREFTAPLRILYLGRLDREQKRVHLFPEILRHLKGSGIPFCWTIAGEGPERAFLEREMRSEVPEQTVKLAGKVPYSQVPQILPKHDIYLLASHYEGLPLALLEAMGQGLVPVVSDLPSGIRELVDEATGCRVSLDDTGGYARAIVWLHENRSEMRKLSMAAQERVHQQFSVSAMADRWLKALPDTGTTALWPDRWKIQAPLIAPSDLRFSEPGRFLRRLKLRFSRRRGQL